MIASIGRFCSYSLISDVEDDLVVGLEERVAIDDLRRRCPMISLSSIIDASRHISASIECGGRRSNWLAMDGSINWLMRDTSSSDSIP